MLHCRTIQLGLSLAIGLAILGGPGGLGGRRAAAQHIDTAAAGALFDEGKQLSAQGRVAEACARFEASAALVAQLGVQLNLADCYERLGRTASAWLAFGEATALARRIGDQPRWQFALDRQTALRARLSRIAITVSGGAAGVVVMLDGARVSEGSFGVRVPIDPGEHTIEATAPGRQPWSTRISVPPDTTVVGVAIPELALASSPTPPAMSAAAALADERPPRQMTPATWVFGGVGVAGAALGTYFGLSARSQWLRAQPSCDRTNACSDAAVAMIERSRRDGAIATAAFITAGAALVTGAVLYLRSPRARAPHAWVAPAISSDAVGIALMRGF